MHLLIHHILVLQSHFPANYIEISCFGFLSYAVISELGWTFATSSAVCHISITFIAGIVRLVLRVLLVSLLVIRLHYDIRIAVRMGFYLLLESVLTWPNLYLIFGLVLDLLCHLCQPSSLPPL